MLLTTQEYVILVADPTINVRTVYTISEYTNQLSQLLLPKRSHDGSASADPSNHTLSRQRRTVSMVEFVGGLDGSEAVVEDRWKALK